MLNAIVHFSLRFRGIIISLACALLFYGLYSVVSAPYDVFPEFAPPQVSIQTEAPGLSPEQVETLVTQPIENAINGVFAVESLRSKSIQGLSAITVVFRNGTDIYRDRQAVAERLTTIATDLPNGVHSPLISPLTSSTTWVMEIGLTSDTQSLMTVRTIADWTVKPRLLAVPGVAGVEVNGGDVRQLQFQFEPQRLIQYAVSVEEVISAARQATGVRGAGFVDTPNQRIVLQTEGQTVTPDQLARTVLIHHNGANVTLGDVAQVVEAPAPAIGAATVRGKPAVLLIVDAAYGSNTLNVTRNIDDAVNDLRATLEAQGIDLHSDVFRAADFIDVALNNVGHSLIIGAILVVVVLFLFLFNFRTAAISCTAIPLSLLAAVIALDKLGLSLNTMTLGGLSIAIGEVVDDAVIDVENIYRRLRANRGSPNSRPTFQVVFDASIEVRSAVVYATFAVILVFFPILNISGLAGRIFGPLGIAYIWAILASLVVALTVTPVLSLLLLGNRELPPEDPPLVHWLKRGYRVLLLGIEKSPRLVITATGVVIALGLGTILLVNHSFLPELREGNLTIHMTAIPGTSLRESLRLGNRLTQEVLEIPHVQSVAQRAGRAELGTDTMGTNESEIDVNLKALNGGQVKTAQGDIARIISDIPGPVLTFNSFLTERINETLSGYRAPIVINLFGSDLDQLDQQAAKLTRVIGDTRGATQVQLQAPPGMPQIGVRLRNENVARWGFDPLSILDVVRTAYGGDIVGQVYEGNRVFDVSVLLNAADRNNVANIGALPVRSPEGNYISLGQLANIYHSSGRYVILHEGARRVQTITCAVEDRPVDEFVREVKAAISRLKLPAGMYVQFSGTAEAQTQTRRNLLVNSTLAGLGILLLLSVVMRNHRNLLLVLANLPFAMVGGMLAAMLSGGNLSLGSLVGFVTLFGITLRNSIMLISHYEHLVEAEGQVWGLDTALRGASERLAPILMTALVTGLGLLPLAIGSGDPGREIEGPMAIVILGGLVTSTLLNLLILPTLALRYGRFETRG